MARASASGDGGPEGRFARGLRRLAAGVARRYRWLAAGLIAGALVGLIISALGTPRYEASATISIRAADTADGDAPPPTAEAAELAGLARDPEVLEAVRVASATTEPVNALRSKVSAVAPDEESVAIDVEASDAVVAADTANALASELSRRADGIAQRRAAAAIQRLDEQLDGAGRARTAAIEEEIAGLQAAAELDPPAFVSSRAAVPGSAASPRTGRNAAIGALFGLIVGVLAAAAAAIRDPRLYRADEIRSRLAIPVLAEVSEDALGRVPLPKRADARPMQRADLDSFRSLRSSLGIARSTRAPRVVMVSGGYPESGTSTVALGLATAAAFAGARTLLLECAPRRPVLAERLGLVGDVGLSDYLGGVAGPREILEAVSPDDRAERHADGGLLVVAPWGEQDSASEPFTSRRFDELVDKAGRAYGLVVLDSGALLADPQPPDILQRVDAVLLCVRAGRATVAEVTALRDALSRLPARPAAGIVTGVPRGAGAIEYRRERGPGGRSGDDPEHEASSGRPEADERPVPEDASEAAVTLAATSREGADVEESGVHRPAGG